MTEGFFHIDPQTVVSTSRLRDLDGNVFFCQNVFSNMEANHPLLYSHLGMLARDGHYSAPRIVVAAMIYDIITRQLEVDRILAPIERVDVELSEEFRRKLFEDKKINTPEWINQELRSGASGTIAQLLGRLHECSEIFGSGMKATIRDIEDIDTKLGVLHGMCDVFLPFYFYLGGRHLSNASIEYAHLNRN